MKNYFILLFILWIYYIYLSHPKYDSVEYKDIKNKVKTGDLILFHALDNINPIFIGSYYGHIGIVYIDPDDENKKPYLFEAFNPDPMPFYPFKARKGIVLCELEHRLNSYRGYCFYKELKIPLDIKLQYGFRDFIRYSLESMEYNTSIFQNSFKKIIFNDDLNSGTNCGELVYLSFIKLNLLPYNYIKKNRRHHLYWVCKVKNLYNNEYLKPVYVLSNYFKAF